MIYTYTTAKVSLIQEKLKEFQNLNCGSTWLSGHAYVAISVSFSDICTSPPFLPVALVVKVRFVRIHRFGNTVNIDTLGMDLGDQGTIFTQFFDPPGV